MREAVGGIVWGKVKNDAVRLMMFAVLALLLGTFLKEPLNKYMHSLHAKAKKADCFIKPCGIGKMTAWLFCLYPVTPSMGNRNSQRGYGRCFKK